jgi:hypothetical protein
VLSVLLQVRSRASCEVSELRAALDAASKDKATLSEQLAVLKTQLCFALQVGGKHHQLLSRLRILQLPMT